MNSWPGGYKHAIDQDEHERWNETHWPGTRQLCTVCDEPTGRCEEDSLFREAGPLCEECYDEKEE